MLEELLTKAEDYQQAWIVPQKVIIKSVTHLQRI
jgi:hypothetical protein